MTLPLSEKIPGWYAMKTGILQLPGLKTFWKSLRYRVCRCPPTAMGCALPADLTSRAGLFKFCGKVNSGTEINGGAELCAGNEVIPRGEMRYTVLMGKCAISRNKKIQKTIKVPGCPPDPEKVAAILTKACFSEK